MFTNEEDMVECPYDKAHRLLRKRLQSHLIKCRKNHPDVELQKCPFNICHLVPEPEFTHHVTNCSDRKLIALYKYDAPEAKEEERPKQKPIECDENWDDTDVPDYNPRETVINKNVIRIPEGTSASERKAFVKQERLRLGGEDDDFPRTPSPPRISSAVSDVDDADESEVEKFRYDRSDRVVHENEPRSSTSSYLPRSRSPMPGRSSHKRRSRTPLSIDRYSHKTRSRSPMADRNCHRRRSRSSSRSSRHTRYNSPTRDRYSHKKRSRSPMSNRYNCPSRRRREKSGSPYQRSRGNRSNNFVGSREHRDSDEYNADEDPYYTKNNERNGGHQSSYSRQRNSRDY